MQLDDLRAKVLFHNSVDVWIALCAEKGKDWNNIGEYRRFVSHMRRSNQSLKSFALCAHEAGAVEREKTAFVEKLAEQNDEDAKTYTIKLSGSSISAIRSFD